MVGRLVSGLLLVASLAIGAGAQRWLHRGLEVRYLLVGLGAFLALVALVRGGRDRGESADRRARACVGIALIALTAVVAYPVPESLAHAAIGLATLAWIDGWVALPVWALVDALATRALETSGASPAALPGGFVLVCAVALVVREVLRRLPDPIAAERLALWALAGGALLAVLVHALSWRPRLGGVDFYWLACEARDASLGPANPDPARFDHLPGALRFWGLAISIVGDRVEPLQWIWLLVLVANLGLVAALVHRHTRSPLLATFAVILAYGADTRLEVFSMTSERLATIPFLVAALLWAGRPFAGRADLGRAVATGVCLGLTVYCKRQGVALAGGAIGWAVLHSARTLGLRAAAQAGGLLVATSLAAFLLPILGEGEGLLPISVTVHALATHPRSGTWGANAWSVLTRVPGLFLQPLAMGAAFAGLRRAELDARVSVVGFLGLGALATFVQFGVAGYAHHALFLVTSGVVGGAFLFPWERLRAPLSRQPGYAFGGALVVGTLLGTLLIGPAGEEGFPALAAATPTSPIGRLAPALARHVQRGEDLVVLPPGTCELFFRLGARARHGAVGYTWMPHLTHPLADSLDWSRVDVAAVVSGAPWGEYHRSDALVAELPARGFEPVASEGHVTLWRRKGPR